MSEAELLVPPVARLYGEPMAEIPKDLYIPPEALEVFLDAFEGPLDLLLYLIRRQNLDVLNIPMAEVTRQYMDYVELMRVKQLELAAEYLVMAAVLIEIKSRMLLPKPVATGEEDADPRAELVRRLLEYEQMKLAARKLDELPLVGRDFALVQVWLEQVTVKRLPEVSLDDLREAWLDVVRRANVTKHHRITREELSVREHMSRILRMLKGETFAEFVSLFDTLRGVPEMVVSFLAILELAREKLVEISQQAPFAPIYVKLAHAEHA
ncbi:MAG: segregation/condensation protein A [Sulfuricella sp.]|nr:segregation/condensation protein A [Sulfuricella sp.]